MNKTVYILITLTVSLILISSCSDRQITCTLKGTVSGRNSDTIYLSKATEYNIQIKIPIIDSSFEYNLVVPQSEGYMLIFKEEYIRGAMKPIYFFPENGEITFKLHSMDDFDKNQTIGGSLNDEYINFKKEYNDTFMPKYKPLNDSVTALVKRKEYFSAKMYDLINDLRNAKDNSSRDNARKKIALLKSTGNDVSQKAKLIDEQTNIIIQESNQWRFKYIEEHSTLVSYYLLIADARELVNKLIKIENIKKGYDLFSKKYPNHPYTSQLKAVIDGLETIKVGRKFIDFKLPDINGNIYALSDLIKDKIALIDLWATWCGPCIMNSRKMIPLYEEFKDKGFTVCGVAGEIKNTNQLNITLEKEKFPWINLVELDYKNHIWDKYGVSNSGGSTFLVDKDGTILAISPTADQVRNILTEKLK